MQSFILVVHIILAILLIVLILVQQGKGADAGAAFGSGASSTVFGAKGSANFMTKLTTLIAIVFFITSLTLAYFASSGTENVRSLVPNQGASNNSVDNIDKNNSDETLP
tara:strand:+ start:434 stop:760 length:327 start_codon:yes stop_codon:yes gene_type:complete